MMVGDADELYLVLCLENRSIESVSSACLSFVDLNSLRIWFPTISFG